MLLFSGWTGGGVGQNCGSNQQLSSQQGDVFLAQSPFLLRILTKCLLEERIRTGETTSNAPKFGFRYLTDRCAFGRGLPERRLCTTER